VLYGSWCTTCCEAHINSADESACLTADNIQNEGKFYLCSQIMGGVENVVSLPVDIPRTGRKGSDLPSKAVLQEYLQFL
jgi:hypothetical protein